MNVGAIYREIMAFSVHCWCLHPLRITTATNTHIRPRTRTHSVCSHWVWCIEKITRNKIEHVNKKHLRLQDFTTKRTDTHTCTYTCFTPEVGRLKNTTPTPFRSACRDILTHNMHKLQMCNTLEVKYVYMQKQQILKERKVHEAIEEVGEEVMAMKLFVISVICK